MAGWGLMVFKKGGRQCAGRRALWCNDVVVGVPVHAGNSEHHGRASGEGVILEKIRCDSCCCGSGRVL